MVRRHRDADAAAGEDFLAVDMHGREQGIDDQVGQFAGFLEHHVAVEDGEFVAAETGEEGFRADGVAQAFGDRCVVARNDGQLTAEEAAMAKWWCTELQKRAVDRCLQLHGGYGYMLEYPIARAYADARITTIYGGTTEIMKEIIGRSLGL